MNFIKNHRTQAVLFVDAAIRFMNNIKRIKMEELLHKLNHQDIMKQVTTALITPELLIEPIEEKLTYEDLTEADTARYKQILQLLKTSK